MTTAVPAVPLSRPFPDEPAPRIAWRHNAEAVLASLRPPARPALYLIDLNGPAGHTSDPVLAAVETLLHAICRRTGTALRLPHGQFLLLQTVTSLAEARDSAEQLARALTRPLPDTGPWAATGPVTLAVTIGVAIGPAVQPDLTALFWAADAALYRANLAGPAVIEVVE